MFCNPFVPGAVSLSGPSATAPRVLLLGLLCLMASRHCLAQKVVVNIPGKIHQEAVKFTPSLHLDSKTTKLVLVTKAKATDQPDKVIYGIEFKDQWWQLVNVNVITKIGTPIPLEAAIVNTGTAKEPTAKVVTLVPDSVAAWRRLKTWPEVAKATNSKTRKKVDQNSEKIRQLVSKVFEKGELGKESKSELIDAYNE